MNQCIFWLRCGDATNAVTPVIGAAGSENGTLSHAAAIFGNGTYSTNTANFATFTQLPDDEHGCIEWLFKYTESSSGLANYTWREPFWMGKGDASTGFCYTIYGKDAGGTSKWHFGLYDGSTYVINTWYNHTWSANDEEHFAIVWNKDKLDATKYAAVDLDGVEITSSTQSFSSLNFGDDTYIFCGKDGSDNAYRPVTSIIDNMRWWDYGKLDFTDRWREAPRPVGILL